MSNMQFDESYVNTAVNQNQEDERGKGLVGKLISHNIVQTSKQAEYLLIGIVIVFLILAVIIYRRGTSNPPLPDPDKIALFIPLVTEC